MKFTTVFLPLLTLAATIQAAPVAEDEDAPILVARTAGPGQTSSQPIFTITGFSNSGSPHSASKVISFTVVSKPFNKSAKCSATVSSPDVATAKYFTKCNPPTTGFGFAWEPTTKTYILTITQNTGGNFLSASGSVPKKIKTQVNKANPNGNYQYLDHLKNFSLFANLV
ncbi:hypothetical protein ABW20_dc0107930 [Dactylellina cionopaga]|nr:hypothetical protein ABW20_dc0107930 [Dactylellina cionopaga]